MRLITLTTDFGNSDPFVGIMKGVILDIYPNAKIVDLTHNISPQNIRQASFILRSSYYYFPKGTIHLCVVDPGVGSSRKPVLIKTKDYFFIGPNNGLFSFVIENEKLINIIELTEKKYWLKNISQTFHGRDIFAPVAAHLAQGKDIKDFGQEITKNKLILLKQDSPIKTKNKIRGTVQYTDHFGNIITNIPNYFIKTKMIGKVKTKKIHGIIACYSGAEAKKLYAIKGSSNFIELFVNKDNAAKSVKAKVGDPVEFWEPT
ncbi:MAG: SAM-dependent chlorinase/fluorinase [Candidatus Melainabacteria bacterium]|nr:SAM-dependent chlorinase/fluorinase [Candidatus Melainabacteria bacterium]